MMGGLAVGYGTFASYAGLFLYSSESPVTWQFVATVNTIKTGQALSYVSPTGSRVVVARQGDGDTVENFVALSSVCPHLGCQVHWESVNERFFCPCHNGAFDREGRPLEGPPAAAGQELSRYPLRIENGLLYIQIPSEGLVTS